MDYTHGILQGGILEWVAFPFSRGSSQPRDQTQVSSIAGGFFTRCATREAQEYWRGSLHLLQGDLPDPGIKPVSPALQADSLPTEPSDRGINAFLNTGKGGNQTRTIISDLHQKGTVDSKAQESTEDPPLGRGGRVSDGGCQSVADGAVGVSTLSSRCILRADTDTFHTLCSLT